MSIDHEFDPVPTFYIVYLLIMLKDGSVKHAKHGVTSDHYSEINEKYIIDTRRSATICDPFVYRLDEDEYAAFILEYT